MNNIANSPPIPSILHKHHPLPATSSRHHRLRMSTRINRTPSINQLLERLSRINPNKCRRPTRRTKNLTILFRPSDYQASGIVFHLIERLVDDGPSSDVRREGGETGVSSEVFVQEEASQEKDDEFGETDGLVHLGDWRGREE